MLDNDFKEGREILKGFRSPDSPPSPGAVEAHLFVAERFVTQLESERDHYRR